VQGKNDAVGLGAPGLAAICAANDDAALAHGEPGAYRNRPAVVLAKQMNEAFSLARSASGGDVLHGAAGDWIMQYAPGDYGVVQAARFAKVYRLAD